MRNLKKFLALVLAMLMVVGATAVVSADFTDVPADNAYVAAINDLAVKGIVRGTSDTTFGPDADVQRYQMALFVARAATGEVGEDADSTLWANGIVPFADVTDYKGAIQYAFLNGIIKGRTETTFDPAGNIAYVDALTMAVRALGYTKLEYPWGFYNKAVELGLTEGVAVDALYTTLDRAETAQIIYNMIYAERADSDVSFATENFDLDVVRTSDLFVITATPEQSYAEGYTSKDHKEEGTFVGIQAIINGIPEGDMIYVPVEKLGIEAADVENYLNYAVELINYDAEAGTFYDAKLGDAPDKVYSADVKFDDKSATKIVIDGTTYNMVETVSGSVLKNELVAFASADINIYTAKDLVVIGDTVVDINGHAVATFKGYVGNTKYYAAMVNVPTDDSEDTLCEHGKEIGETCNRCGGTAVADGELDTNLFIKAGTIIPEDKALKAWGYEAQGSEYIKYSTMTADDIEKLGAFELQLFDDDKNGKYDRAVANTVYMSVKGTYKEDLDPAKKNGKEVCDAVISELVGTDVEDADVAYSEELEAGTLFTFTYNKVINAVDVIETFDLNTAKLNKIDTTTKDSEGNKLYKFTFGDTVYTGKTDYTNADLGAIVVDYDKSEDGKFNLKNLNAGLKFDILENWEAFKETADLGWDYNFYTVNGFVIFAEAVEEAAKTAATTKFVVLDSVADFDFGAMDLNVYADGEEKVVALNKFMGTPLANLPDWFYGIFIGDVSNFYRGSIYAINETADGINILGFVNDETYMNYYEDTDKDGVLEDNGDDKVILDYIDNVNTQDLTTTIDGYATLVFDGGIIRTSDSGNLKYGQRIRTTDTTVFYFINYGPAEDKDGNAEDIKKPTSNQYGRDDSTDIKVYVGSAGDGTITLDDHSYVLVDEIGYKANTTQGSTQLIIVVNALDWDFDAEIERDTYGYFIGNADDYEADEATDLELKGYDKDAKFYKFTDAAIDIDTGKLITVYSTDRNLEAGKVYEFDANGVILNYDKIGTMGTNNKLITSADYAIELADLVDDVKYAMYDGKTVAIDYLVDEKTYDVVAEVGGSVKTIFDYDEYVINKITLVNIGNDITIVREMKDGKPVESKNLEYKEFASTTAWDRVVNYFYYGNNAGLNTITDSMVFAVKVSDTELLLLVDAE